MQYHPPGLGLVKKSPLLTADQKEFVREKGGEYLTNSPHHKSALFSFYNWRKRSPQFFFYLLINNIILMTTSKYNNLQVYSFK